MSTQQEIKYWALPKEALLRAFDTSTLGLDDAEAARRLKDDGFNEIPYAEHRTALTILLSKFKNPLVYVLIVASGIAGFLGDVTEAIIIVAILLANALLGFSQEYKSERALEELKKYLSYTTIVFRKGQKRTIDTKELVPGDLVYLAIGDIVPAEIRLLDTDELQTNESALTGESTPVDKISSQIALDHPLPHQLVNTALMSSTVLNGSGMGLVVATGRQTYFGRVASSLSLLPPKTDFQKNIASFGSFLIKVIVLLVLFVFLVNAVLGNGIVDSLLFSLAIAVGIIPEALPVIITVGLSNGALNLVKKKVVVKRLEAIEDVGNVDVFCTDKTGTLTQNEVKIQDIVDPSGRSRRELITYALLCNTAVVEGDRILGNPIDVAIWKTARNQHFDEERLNDFTRVHEIPFHANRRRMSIVVESDNQRILISKGAPESILSVSTTVGYETETQPLPTVNSEVASLIEHYSQAGSRLIALACKDIENKVDYSLQDESNLTFRGLLVLNDPPKEDAANAITRLQSLGITLKVLSGDDPIVTTNVCQQVGINVRGRVLTGMDLDNKQEHELRKLVEDYDVFGRVTPDQKYAIINALKQNGHIVGFLGDGVNDAPALKLADAGISVDSGVPVAKEAASIILLEKSLSTIADGVLEGRKAFSNMIKYIMNTTSASFGNMVTVALGSLFLPFILLLPSQILLTNLLTDAPLLTISTDNFDEEGLRTPKKWSIDLIARFVVFFGVLSSIFDFATISFLVYFLQSGPVLFRTGWFLESVLSEILVTFSVRTRRKFYRSRASNLLIATSTIMVMTTLLVVYSPIGVVFEFVTLPPWFLAVVLGILATYFFLVESLKHLYFSRYDVYL